MNITTINTNKSTKNPNKKTTKLILKMIRNTNRWTTLVMQHFNPIIMRTMTYWSNLKPFLLNKPETTSIKWPNLVWLTTFEKPVQIPKTTIFKLKSRSKYNRKVWMKNYCAATRCIKLKILIKITFVRLTRDDIPRWPLEARCQDWKRTKTNKISMNWSWKIWSIQRTSSSCDWKNNRISMMRFLSIKNTCRKRIKSSLLCCYSLWVFTGFSKASLLDWLKRTWKCSTWASVLRCTNGRNL